MAMSHIEMGLDDMRMLADLASDETFQRVQQDVLEAQSAAWANLAFFRKEEDKIADKEIGKRAEYTGRRLARLGISS